MMRRLLAWCLAVLVLLAGTVQAQPQPVAVGTQGSYKLTKAFQYLEDEARSLRFEDLARPEVQSRFRPIPSAGPGANFGLTLSAIWLRVDVDVAPDAAGEWLFEIGYATIDRAELWTPGPGGYQRQLAGDLQPFSTRAVPHRNHVLPVRLAPGPATVYLRLESQGTVAAPATLWRPAALWKHDQGAYAALALYFGLLLGLLLYNLLLFVSTRDVGFLFYVVFVAAMGVGQAALSGLGAQFVWTEWTWWNTVSPPVGMTTSAIFGLQFARSFLASRTRMPRLDRLLLLQGAGWTLALLAALLLPYIVSSWMVTVLAVFTVASMVVIGILSLRRQVPGARYFFTAWAVLLLGVVTLSLHNTGVLPSNALTANALLIGSALEMVLLSFALGDRMNVARSFREKAQARIDAEHAMVEALSESQDRLKQVLQEREVILQNSIVGIAFLSPSGRFKWANQAMMDIFGAGSDGVDSMEPFYLSREQYLQVGGEVAETVSRGEVYERELQVRQANGELIWIQLSGKAVSRQDLSQGTVWVIMDITERKVLQEQLQRTMSEREAVLNNAVVGIVLSVYRRHEWVNEKFAQMLGYPRQILIGQPSTYIHPDEAAWEQFGHDARAALIATNVYNCERQLRRRNGELFWVQMGGSCVRPNDPDSGVIWTFLDITDRKESEAEIREALEQQKELNELRTRFVAMTSHEFRTPLAAILSAEELLRHYGDRLPEAERMETLDGIAAGVQRMSRMLDRVLLIGQSEANMLDFAPQPLDLPSLVHEVAQEARQLDAGLRRNIAVHCAPNVGEGVYDEKLLRHILGNLLSNALKYSPQGGEVRLTVRCEEEDTVFEVADRGIGIPAEEVGHLFESFHRASNVGSIPGTGLGLAIVKNAVDLHGGSIAVDSTVGRGTRFTVRLSPARETVSG